MKTLIIKIIKTIITSTLWHYLFYRIENVNFINLIQDFATYVRAMPIVNVINFLRDLIYNRTDDSLVFRTLGLARGINYRLLYDTNNKIFFWVLMTFSVIIFRGFILFKKKYFYDHLS